MRSTFQRGLGGLGQKCLTVVIALGKRPCGELLETYFRSYHSYRKHCDTQLVRWREESEFQPRKRRWNIIFCNHSTRKQFGTWLSILMSYSELTHQIFWKCANWKEHLFMLFNFFISQWFIMTVLASKKVKRFNKNKQGRALLTFFLK